MHTFSLESFSLKYILSSLSACVAETVTYPLDLTKTRLQIQGEKAASAGQSYAHRGMIKTAIGIAREEGFFKLWQGVTPALARHMVYSGCRMAFYEKARELMGRNDDGTFPLWKAVVSGMSAGALAQFFASPTDLIKVQMQMEGRRRLEGKAVRVHGLLHAGKKIVSEAGVRGLWKGWVPNCQRAALVNLGDLTTYDVAKHVILHHTPLKDNYVTHSAASVCAGFAAAVLGTPADVIKTRVMNQPTGPDGRGLWYKSSLDCLLQTSSKEGFFALYKGFIPIWARMAPWSLVFWLTYEEIRKLSGVSSF